jgi:hypothetical protein
MMPCSLRRNRTMKRVTVVVDSNERLLRKNPGGLNRKT